MAYSKGYGKRPLWQWILIYLLIGGIAYGFIYYFIIAKKGSSLYNNNYSPTTSTSPSYKTPGY